MPTPDPILKFTGAKGTWVLRGTTSTGYDTCTDRFMNEETEEMQEVDRHTLYIYLKQGAIEDVQ